MQRQMPSGYKAMLQSHSLLTVMMERGYVDILEITDHDRAGEIIVNHTSRSKKCVQPQIGATTCTVLVSVWFHPYSTTSAVMGPWKSMTQTHRLKDPGILL